MLEESRHYSETIKESLLEGLEELSVQRVTTS